MINNILSTESKRWFSRFSPLQQAKFNKIAEGTDEQVLRTWLGQFTEEDKVVKYLIDNRHHPHYPELFFYTVSQLMADCQAFKIGQVASIEHTRFVFATTFSDDGNHMVTQSFCGQSKICSLSPGGNWMEKTTIYGENSSFLSWVRFSGDGKHVKIGYDCSPAKIYALNSDGNWMEQAVIDHQARSADFRTHSRYLVINCYDTAAIYYLDMSGSWIEKAILDSTSIPANAAISLDGRFLVISANNPR